MCTTYPLDDKGRFIRTTYPLDMNRLFMCTSNGDGGGDDSNGNNNSIFGLDLGSSAMLGSCFLCH
jgi:hypothetical protein